MPGIIFSVVAVVIGAVLRYAVTDRIADVELSTVGGILMVAGAATFIVSFVLANPWRRRTRVEQVEDAHGRGYRRVEKTTDSAL